MQINVSKVPMKEFFKYLGWLLLFGFLWFRGCSGNDKSSVTAKVVIPEVKGIFEAKKPDQEKLREIAIISQKTNLVIKDYLTTEKTTSSQRQENDRIKELITENEKLKTDFAKANDSVKELKFKDAVQLHRFSSDFEDDNLIININGIVQGEVKELTPNYTIKERKAETQVKSKETAFRLLGGLEVGNTITLDNFGMKANLMFQNRKGNIISGSFNTNQTIWVGYNWSIFDVKR